VLEEAHKWVARRRLVAEDEAARRAMQHSGA
jgi:hypothetical protein